MFQKEKKSNEKTKERSSRVTAPERRPGLIITVVLLVLAIVFSGLLIALNILPPLYLILFVVAVLLLIAVIWMFTRNVKRKKMFSIAAICAFFLALLLLYGIIAVSQIISSLDSMTGKKTEVAEVAVYVNEHDPAQTLEDLKGYKFGILETLDRENTDEAVEKIEKDLGDEIDVGEYPGLTELIDGLYAYESSAIVLNVAYLDVIEETEGYEDVGERIREIARYKIEKEIEPASNIDPENKIITCFISGIDSRTGLVAKSRSDVNIIATVNTETRQIALVSTPRDYYVPLSVSNGVPDKLTHAGIYGVDVSKATLEMIYGTPIDYYFRVNFSGFEQIVDSLGGVTVDSQYAFRSRDGYVYTQGENFLNGAQALSFVRERKAFPDGDFQRGRNQMALIKGVLKKVASPEILATYSGLLDAMEGSFEMSMPSDLVKKLLQAELDGEKEDWNIVSYAVSGSGAMRPCYSSGANLSVILPDETTVEKAKVLMQQVRDGETAVDPNAVSEEDSGSESEAA